ncbi:hypothetical protein E8E15_001121 [Penicillium rubens]|nr:hypothetical protein E8E15_001121 [Penicillium rubens]
MQRLNLRCRRRDYDRLGLLVAPGQVRLQPPPEDGYAWSFTESRASLLNSNLSSGAVGLLQTICKELGRSFEAVSPQVLQGLQSGPKTEGRAAAKQRTNRDGESDGSFTAKLHNLECANHNLSLALNRTRTRLEESESEGRSLRAQICALQTIMETVGAGPGENRHGGGNANVADTYQDTAFNDDTQETFA